MFTRNRVASAGSRPRIVKEIPMLPVEIRRVDSRRERVAFVESAALFYRDDPHWVPPLVSDQLPFIDPARGVFFEHGEAQLFLAYRGSTPVGRISAHVNLMHDRIFGGSKGFVGFFECENSRETAHALFGAAENWLRGKGRTVAEGPMSFGVYDETGILIHGFDSDPYLLTSHNPPYYRELWESEGWEKSVDWHAYRGRKGETDKDLDPRYHTLSERVLKRSGIVVRTVDVKAHLDRETAIAKEIFTKAWEENWGHVPLSDREWDRLRESVKQLVIPELSLIVELEGKPIAFALSLYDANVAVKRIGGRLFPFGFLVFLATAKKTRRFRLALMGVMKEHRNKGIEIALYTRIIDEGIKLGFEEVEASMIVETNVPMVSSIERLHVERYRTWRIYRKDLTS
jgi:GNAT superfamily N-acetyltransferase